MTPDEPQITSIVLAGGKSARLGSNKALQTLHGRSLLQWVIDCLGTFSTEIIIATASGESIPCSSRGRLTTVADVHAGKGPLGGIYSGLMASSSPSAIAVGCDMPFLSRGLLLYMHGLSTVNDVVVAAPGGLVEPLCAVYSKRCLAPIEDLLERNRLGVRELLEIVSVRYVRDDEFDRFDPGRLSLFNVNSTADLAIAETLARAVQSSDITDSRAANTDTRSHLACGEVSGGAQNSVLTTPTH